MKIIITALAAALLSSAVHAEEIERQFFMPAVAFTDGWDEPDSVGMTGYFRGNDANADGVLSLDELQSLVVGRYFGAYAGTSYKLRLFPDYIDEVGFNDNRTGIFEYDASSNQLSFAGYSTYHRGYYDIGTDFIHQADENARSNWTATRPADISVTVSPVPEPGTLALVALGGFGVLARRRAQARR